MQEKVITIHNWWDGPLTGLAYYHNILCIYERIFDEIQDDYLDEYYLTPVNDSEQAEIMMEWNAWCQAVSDGNPDLFYQTHTEKDMLRQILSQSDTKRKYRKKARFQGSFHPGCLPVDYTVIWSD